MTEMALLESEKEVSQLVYRGRKFGYAYTKIKLDPYFI